MTETEAMIERGNQRVAAMKLAAMNLPGLVRAVGMEVKMEGKTMSSNENATHDADWDAAPQAAASTPEGAKARAARVLGRCVYCDKTRSRHMSVGPFKTPYCAGWKGEPNWHEFTLVAEAPGEPVAQGGALTVEQVERIMDLHKQRDEMRVRLTKAEAFTNAIAEELATLNSDIVAYLHSLTRPAPKPEVR